MYRHDFNFRASEVLIYLRKSQSDDPLMSVTEVLARHESDLDKLSVRLFGEKIPESNKYREVVSGETLSERPEINKVLRLMESPRIKAVMVIDPQRLSRGDLEDIGRLSKLFKLTNTMIITPEHSYDLSDSYERDALERELKQGNEYLEYVKKVLRRGRLISVSQGNYIGSIPPYGYDKTKIMENGRECHTLAINEEQANVVRLIFDLYVNKDYGYHRISNHLEELNIPAPKGKFWTSAGVRPILGNIHYIGKVKWNGRKTVNYVKDGKYISSRPWNHGDDLYIYDGKHEAIISEELFNAAQVKRGKMHREKAKTTLQNPFAGLLYCECGYVMDYKKYKGCQPRFVCHNQKRCENKSCTVDALLTRVCDALKTAIEDFECKVDQEEDHSIELHQALIKSLENKLIELEEKEIAQWDAQSNPDESMRMPPHIFQRLNSRLQQDKAETLEALNKAREAAPNPVDYEEKIVRFHAALESLKTDGNIADQNRLLKECIKKIVYSREQTFELDSHGTNINLDITLKI